MSTEKTIAMNPTASVTILALLRGTIAGSHDRLVGPCSRMLAAWVLARSPAECLNSRVAYCRALERLLDHPVACPRHPAVRPFLEAVLGIVNSLYPQNPDDPDTLRRTHEAIENYHKALDADL
jgi:hypothetical protein